MKVTVDEYAREVNFKELKNGEVFCFNGKWCMKTKESFYNESGIRINAVDLEDGSIFWLSPVEVIRFKAELHLS